MKKYFLAIALTLILSGCSSMMQRETVSVNTTNNGSILFSHESKIKNLCTKKVLDSLVEKYDEMAVFNEFALANYETIKFENNKQNYHVLAEYPEKCQYQVAYFDWMKDANYVEYLTIDLEKNAEVNFVKLFDDKVFENYINNDEKSAVALLTKTILKNYDANTFKNSNVVAEQSGKYRLVSKPVYRIYHFEDERLIYNFDIAGVHGLYFQLIKID